MACAKPVIASASGGIPEAIENGVNGYLIPIKEGKVDGEAFLHRAKRLLNDPLLRVKMGEKGREKTLNLFTNDQTTQKYLEILGIINLR
jgi:glycosyltransferase involved in cell wall biosynthesis